MDAATALTGFEEEVLRVIRALQERGVRPTYRLIEDAMGVRRRAQVHKARKRLVAAGLVTIDDTRGRPWGYRVERSRRAVGEIVEDDAARRGTLPVLNPGPYTLDDLTARAASNLIRRLARRRLLATLWRAR
jgi:hypothetical protein